MIEEAIRDFLLAQSAIFAIVSERIFNLSRSVKTKYPAITFQSTSARRLGHLDQSVETVIPETFLVTCWSALNKEVKDLSVLVEEALSSSSFVSSNAAIQSSEMTGDRGSGFSKDSRIYSQTKEYEIWYDRSLLT